MERESVNVVAEVCIVVPAKVGLIKSGAIGKDMIDLGLVDLARIGEAVDERRVSQTAGMGKRAWVDALYPGAVQPASWSVVGGLPPGSADRAESVARR